MVATCVLHIGGYKTGTTYLQRQLVTHHDTLLGAGVLLPGGRRHGVHAAAALAVLERPDLKGRPVPRSAWLEVRDAMVAHDGPVALVTCEHFGSASHDQIERLVGELDGAPVRIVLTARDLVRVVPAAWQELMKGGHQWSWPQFVDTISSRVGRALPPGPGFWRTYDWSTVARRWTDVVGPEALTVVTVPPAGSPPELLWDRFATACGIPAGAVTPGPEPANPSLDTVSSELLRQLNIRSAGQLPADGYVREVRRVVAGQVLSGRGGPPVRLGPRETEWAQTEGRRIADALAALGVAVVGSLDDLVGTSDGAQKYVLPSDSELLDASLDAMTSLVGRLSSRAVTEQRDATPRRRRRQPAVEIDVELAPAIAVAPTPATARLRKRMSSLARRAYERIRL